MSDTYKDEARAAWRLRFGLGNASMSDTTAFAQGYTEAAKRRDDRIKQLEADNAKLRDAVSESITEMVNFANFVDDEPSVQQALRDAVSFLKTATGIDLVAKAREAREGGGA